MLTCKGSIINECSQVYDTKIGFSYRVNAVLIPDCSYGWGCPALQKVQKCTSAFLSRSAANVSM